jgi:hypothetical protein
VPVAFSGVPSDGAFGSRSSGWARSLMTVAIARFFDLAIQSAVTTGAR